MTESLRRAEYAIRANVNVVRPLRGWITEITEDAVRHIALALGDSGPGASVQDSAARHVPLAIGYGVINGGPGSVDQALPVLDDAAGLSAVIAGDTWRWFRPLRLGDRLGATAMVTDIRPIERSGSLTALVVSEQVDITDATGRLLARLSHRSHLSVPRATVAVEPASPADQEQQLLAEHEQRSRTVYAPRLLGALRPGDRLERLAFGPLSLEHLTLWLAATGSTMPWVDAAAHRARDRHPGAFVPDPGVPGRLGTREREHFGSADGHGAFDFGSQRIAWFLSAAQYWSGPDGLVDELDVRLRKMNRLGDITWIDASVRSARNLSGGKQIELVLEAHNHRGELTATGTATVLLPKENGNDSHSIGQQVVGKADIWH